MLSSDFWQLMIFGSTGMAMFMALLLCTHAPLLEGLRRAVVSLSYKYVCALSGTRHVRNHDVFQQFWLLDAAGAVTRMRVRDALKRFDSNNQDSAAGSGGRSGGGDGGDAGTEDERTNQARPRKKRGQGHRRFRFHDIMHPNRDHLVNDARLPLLGFMFEDGSVSAYYLTQAYDHFVVRNRQPVKRDIITRRDLHPQQLRQLDSLVGNAHISREAKHGAAMLVIFLLSIGWYLSFKYSVFFMLWCTCPTLVTSQASSSILSRMMQAASLAAATAAGRGDDPTASPVAVSAAAAVAASSDGAAPAALIDAAGADILRITLYEASHSVAFMLIGMILPVAIGSVYNSGIDWLIKPADDPPGQDSSMLTFGFDDSILRPGSAPWDGSGPSAGQQADDEAALVGVHYHKNLIADAYQHLVAEPSRRRISTLPTLQVRKPPPVKPRHA